MITPAPILVTPIGVVRGGRAQPTDDGWDAVEAVIALDAARFGTDAVAGLEAFSHLEVVYHFHRVEEDAVETAARHPRGNPDWPRIGIFAQRAKDRPNRIGVSLCRILSIDGLEIRVAGLDAIDGTPILDLKPYMTGFAPRGAVREAAWARELMRGYW